MEPLLGAFFRKDESLIMAALKFQVSSFDPCLHFVFDPSGGAVGALATHIDGVLGRGGPDVLAEVRKYRWAAERRFGVLRFQIKSFGRVGTEVRHPDVAPAPVIDG